MLLFPLIRQPSVYLTMEYVNSVENPLCAHLDTRIVLNKIYTHDSFLSFTNKPNVFRQFLTETELLKRTLAAANILF